VALREGNQVWKLDRRTGKAIHIAGTGQKGMTGNGGPAIAATISGPKGLSVAPDGRVYVADTESHSVRVIDPKTGRMEAFVGDGMKGDGPDGEASACRLARPHGVFADKNGSVFIGDSENHKVRVVTR
jgi:YVTN family beta-propeller protein